MAAADITAFATALTDALILTIRDVCNDRWRSNEKRRRETTDREFSNGGDPVERCDRALGDIDVENRGFDSDAFNVRSFMLIETLAGSAGRTTVLSTARKILTHKRDCLCGNIFQERASCLESLSVLFERNKR